MKLRIIIFAFIALLTTSRGLCQDTIIFSDMSIQAGKVIEVNLNTVKYLKAEIVDGPIYEVKKKDLLYIKYPSGYKDIFNRESIQIIKGQKRTPTVSFDTIDHAELYIVFNDGYSDDQRFPLYFNGMEVLTLKNKSRFKANIYSHGLLKVERYSRKKHGPGALFDVENGGRYAIEIIINDPYGLDMNHRFHIKVYDDPIDVNYFITSKYLSFDPDPSRDIFVEENLELPWIWEEE